MSGADYDMETARHMFQSGRFVYVVFMCHLTIEKTLKAIVTEATQKAAPRTHDLIYLANLADIQFSNSHLDFIGKINNASIVTRYPEDFSQITTSYPKHITEGYLEKTEEVVEWLKKDRRLKPS